MPVADIYQVTNEFEYQGNANNYSWYLRVRAEGAPTLVVDNLVTFGQERQTAWLPLHNPSVNFRCVVVRQVYPTNSLPMVNAETEAGNRTCTPSLDHLPGQCSCVVTLYGNKANPDKNNRGRDFICGQCCADQLNGFFGVEPTEYADELVSMYAACTNQYINGGNEFDIGVYSPSRAKPPTWPDVPSIPPFFWPLEYVRARAAVRTQRRRQPLDPCEAYADSPITGSP